MEHNYKLECDILFKRLLEAEAKIMEQENEISALKHEVAYLRGYEV